VNHLITEEKWEEISKVIDSIDIDSPTGTPSFITFLAAKIHDRSFEHTLKLETRLKELGLTPTSLSLNYFL